MPKGMSKEKTEQRPFSFQWLNSCYQQTLLPGGPWHKVEEVIAGDLAQKVEKQFNNPKRKEMLMELLGEDFCERYFPKKKREPLLLEPPKMSEMERNTLHTEAQAWLNSQMYKSVKDRGYKNILNLAANSQNPPADFADFLQHTFSTFHAGLDRELFLQERILTKKKAADLARRRPKKSEYLRVPAPSRIKPLGSTLSLNTVASSEKPSSSMVRGLVHQVEGDPPPLWGPQSDAVGRSIVSVLERDPRKFEHVAARLHGRQLPGNLRSFMWSDVLFRMERQRMDEVEVEKIVRERFAKAVSRAMTELKIKQPTQSPINGLIENAVIETYTKTTAMAGFRSPEFMKETARALNVLYVFDRSYEPYLIYWLFPIQIAARKLSVAAADRGEQALELAMYLDLLNSNCFPSWPAVFAIAERVMDTLSQADPELHDHLRSIATKNCQVNPKEFLIQLIHQEREKAEELLKATPGTSRAAVMSAEILADPLIFLRRWIGEGFVSVLDTPGVMYVWDQCFMQLWEHSVLQNICLSLLELMRHRFMEATDYISMKEAFLVEPCKLYTCDVQRAWIHVENAGNLLEIPYFNRQRPKSPRSHVSVAATPEPDQGLLQPVGIKQVFLKLVVPTEAVKRELWLAKLDTGAVKLCVGVYFGTIKMKSRISLAPAEERDSSKDSYGNTVYQLAFPADKFVFEDLDISFFDVERELGAYPYSIINVEYSHTDKRKGPQTLALGWARLPLFKTRDSGWTMLAGETTVTLHPGDVPESLIAVQPETPMEDQIATDNRIGYSSKLVATVYDPSTEPRSPPPVLPQVPPKDTRQTPRPEPTPTLQSEDDDGIPWVETDPSAASDNPPPSAPSQPFDLYIDQVRFIPDNASIIKVTGRVLKGGELDSLPDILAIPDLKSSARSPCFPFRMTINSAGKNCSPDTLLLLRAYTVDIVTEKVVVIGSCLFAPFALKSQTLGLKVGGHQLRLRSGMPDMQQGIQGLKESDLDSNLCVPACSLLIRLLPHTQSPIPRPAYKSGYYQSEVCRPTVSETRIFASFQESMAYPATEAEMVKRVQTIDGKKPGRTEAELAKWLEQRLFIKREENAQPASDLDLERVVRYRIKVGVNIKINEAHKLPGGMYTGCFARVVAGQKVLGMNPTVEGHGLEEKMVALQLDPLSPLQHPSWTDPFKTLHAFYDNHSSLVVQVFGAKVAYNPNANHKSPGTVTAEDRSPLQLSDENKLAWAVLPMFDGNAALMGIYHAPLFHGSPTPEILDQMSKTPVEQVLAGLKGKSDLVMEGASILVTMWDAHFELDEVPLMAANFKLLEQVGDRGRYEEAITTAAGELAQSLVLKSLDTKSQKQGTKGQVFQKEQKFFFDQMPKVFFDAMDEALTKEGLGPLPQDQL